MSDQNKYISSLLFLVHQRFYLTDKNSNFQDFLLIASKLSVKTGIMIKYDDFELD